VFGGLQGGVSLVQEASVGLEPLEPRRRLPRVEVHKLFFRSRLTGPTEVAGASKREIGAGDLFAGPERPDRFEPARRERIQRTVQKDATPRAVSAPDTTSELMELRESEAFGSKDDDARGLRHIDPHFDHRSGDEDLRIPTAEGSHCAPLRLHLLSTVKERDVDRREGAGELRGFLDGARDAGRFLVLVVVACFDSRTDEKRPLASPDRLAELLEYMGLGVLGQNDRFDRDPPSRAFLQGARSKLAAQREGESPRDGRRAEGE